MHHNCALSRLIGAVAVTLAATACGGGGVSSADAAAATTVPGFSGTAHLTTSNTVLYTGKTYGLTRSANQGLVDQCNGFRAGYNLAAVSPPEATMASLDVSVHEKYLDTDKALTVITGKGLTLPDMKRWLNDYSVSASSGSLPAVPPDCTQATVVETRSGTLWRDGLVYDLHYDTLKANARKASTTPVSYQGTTTFASLPIDHQLGQTCRQVVGVTDLSTDSQACIWDLFPYASYLNWPFALTGHVQFGPTPTLFENIVPVAIDHGQAFAPDVFQIPAGFVVTGP